MAPTSLYSSIWALGEQLVFLQPLCGDATPWLDGGRDWRLGQRETAGE